MSAVDDSSVRPGDTGVPASAGISTEAVRLALRQAANQAGFSRGRLAAGKPGYAYGDYWYQVNDGDGSVEAGGRFGQKIYINPAKGVSVVKFSSRPDAAPRATTAAAGRSMKSRNRPLQDAQRHYAITDGNVRAQVRRRRTSPPITGPVQAACTGENAGSRADGRPWLHAAARRCSAHRPDQAPVRYRHGIRQVPLQRIRCLPAQRQD